MENRPHPQKWGIIVFLLSILPASAFWIVVWGHSNQLFVVCAQYCKRVKLSFSGKNIYYHLN